MTGANTSSDFSTPLPLSPKGGKFPTMRFANSNPKKGHLNEKSSGGAGE